MKEEKMLIKQEAKNIFRKAIDFVRNIFWTKKKESITNKREVCIQNHSIKDDLQKQNELLQLQKDYEVGTIKEIDLSEEQKNNLAKLYQRQIQDLQRDKENYKRTLNLYKDKIMVARSELNGE